MPLPAPSAIPIEINPHVDRRHVVLSIDDFHIGLNKAQALHAAVLLVEHAAGITEPLTDESRDLLVQLSRRLSALAAGMN